MSFLEWSSALTMGLMGSTHCVVMCGPISTMLTASPKTAATDVERERTRIRLPLARARRREWTAVVTTHAGRLFTYSCLGALAGALGAGIRHLVPLDAIQSGAEIMTALVLVISGLYLAGLLQRLSRIERPLAALFLRLKHLLAIDGSEHAGYRFLSGAIWGLMPCGLVMGAIGIAILSGSAIRGAATMLVFGAGTLPALTATRILAAAFVRVVQNVWVRRLAGTMVVVLGLVHVVFAVESARAIGAGETERPCCAHRHALEAMGATHATTEEQ